MDPEVQSSIIKEIEDKRVAEEKERSEEIIKAKKESECVEKTVRKNDRKPNNQKQSQTKRPKRETGKHMIFFVFQGNTFSEESRGRYIWAPITNKSGWNIHHWNNLLNVRKGDIILHGYKGEVVAISTALDKCYECKQPKELKRENLWEKEGRRVDCEYILIRDPIKTKNYKDNIIKLSVDKYSPFDKEGNGNRGYLFEINRDLARIFVRESAKINKYLLKYDFI